ncbi:hypothetical protein RFN58_07165 [Streptomyces iakyrus]|uniref:hypothetical protein n=1 Tax=Streptomyces iakyrus TaxID=68219 RepID=UPI000524172C|nr:hypothetical protein [Streptomyces iakyrus]
MTRPISDLDVGRTQLEADVRKTVARQRLTSRIERANWLVAHPDWPTGHATAGEAAEYRHLLYDADPDATTPALDYPAPKDTQ